MHVPATRSATLQPALLAWLLGVALQLQQAELSAPWLYVGLVCGALALFAGGLRGSGSRARLACLVLACMALGWGSTGIRAVLVSQKALAPALEGRDIEVVGRIDTMPQFSETATRFRFAPEEAWLEGQPVPLPPRLALGWYPAQEGALARALPRLQAGERWRMTVRLKAPHGSSNPHGFDFELWMWEQGLQASGYVRTGPRHAPPQRLTQTGRHPVEWARQQVRDAIFERMQSATYLGEVAQRVRLAGVVAALVTGDQRAIERSDWDVFRATGVAHLVSISGLHVTLFAWLATRLLQWLWRRMSRLCLVVPATTAGGLGGLLLAGAYALFSGWGVPSQRTIWMLACVTLLRLSGRQWPWPAVWLLTCAVVVAVDPWSLLQAGFWLSFVAVGVLFASGQNHAQPRPHSGWQRLGAALREQWLLTLALSPLSLLLFGQVSLIGLLANALAIPWVTGVITPLSLLGVLLPPLWEAAAMATQGMLWVLQGLATLPWSHLEWPQAPWVLGVAAVLGGLALGWPGPWPLRLLGLPLVLPVLLWQPPRPVPGQFDLLATDIGQGTAVLVRTAHHALLFDAGPRYSLDSDAGHRVLVPLLRALGVRPDHLVLSHRDSDHTGGAEAMLAWHPQAQVISSIESTHPLQVKTRIRVCQAGQSWVWDGVRFDILHPDLQDYAQLRRSNALSCVLRISNGAQTALLTGDIEQAQERLLLARQATLRADVLLVPHHGSQTSSSPAFLDAVAPRLALVQAGYRNRYGHPAPAVLARYAERGIPVVDSVHCGAAHWQSDAMPELRCQRQQVRRYWHHQAP